MRMIASIMKKSFQKGVGEDLDLLRSVVGVAEALMIRVTTISYIVVKRLFCAVVSFDQLVRRKGGGLLMSVFVRNSSASAQSEFCASGFTTSVMSSKFDLVRTHVGCLALIWRCKFPALK